MLSGGNQYMKIHPQHSVCKDHPIQSTWCPKFNCRGGWRDWGVEAFTCMPQLHTHTLAAVLVVTLWPQPFLTDCCPISHHYDSVYRRLALLPQRPEELIQTKQNYPLNPSHTERASYPLCSHKHIMGSWLLAQSEVSITILKTTDTNKKYFPWRNMWVCWNGKRHAVKIVLLICRPRHLV